MFYVQYYLVAPDKKLGRVRSAIVNRSNATFAGFAVKSKYDNFGTQSIILLVAKASESQLSSRRLEFIP
jgi:hypothetical protein